MSPSQIFAAALALKPKLRGELLKALLDSFAALPFQNANATELKRRSASTARVSHASAIATARATT